jgi:hypothetical protein
MRVKTYSYQNSFSMLVCSFVACWFVGPAPMRAGDLDQFKLPGEQTGPAGYGTNTFEEHFVDTNRLKLRLEPSGKTSLVAGYVTDTGQGRLAKLYQQLLSGSCSQGFVSFERVIESPKRGPWPPAPTAVAFCWAGARYLIASSRGAAVTNAEALESGDKLYGFDGEAYWCWHRNPPVRVYEKTDEHRGSGPPADLWTTLRVISKAEVVQGQGRYQPDVAFSTSTALVGECREVVQFGFAHPLRGSPRLAGSDLTFESAEDGATVRAHLAGDPHRPAGLSYSLPTGEGFRLLFDYGADVVNIARLSGTNVTAEIRYHLLATRTGGQAQAPAFFSWQAHVPEADRVMVEVVTNGATFLASITANNELLPEKMLVPARPLTRTAH